MINLLPNSQKETILREYRRRLLTVVVFLLITAAAFSTVLLIPSFFASEAKLAALTKQAELEKTSEERDGNEMMINEADTIQKKLSLLRMEAPRSPVNSLVLAIVERRGSRIFIRNLQYERRGATAKLDVRGVAANREALLAFVGRLEQEPRFAAVHSPVSNLVRDRGIEFTIQIALTP